MAIDREIDPPASAVFWPLGWDEDATTDRKHYRRFYPKELERTEEVLPVPSPFQSYDILKGQTRGAKASLWASLTGKVKTDDSGEVSTIQKMGRFKAVIEVEGREDKKAYLQKKAELIQAIKKNLRQLAENRGMKNFMLDLNLLETLEGRMAME